MMRQRHRDNPESREHQHTWLRWYVLVLLWHVLVILLLFVFTYHFHPV